MEEHKSKKPDNSDFKQQRLPAWQPLLTPWYVVGTFIVVGCIFLPIGIGIVVSSNGVVELTRRYDDLAGCRDLNGSVCKINITIEEDMSPPVYFYYRLSNFYQNHRRYVKSRSDEQLRGSPTSLGACSPIEKRGSQVIYPCGLIANSFFNDTFNATVFSGDTSSEIAWTNKGIAWQSDIDEKFKFVDVSANPDVTTLSLEGSQLPRVDNEEFIVWMRTAGLPTFRKLHRKINQKLHKGEIVELTITNNFMVSSFSGEKAVVLTTTSWLGGKNDFLGWAYIAVGCLCLALGIVFCLKQVISPRRLGDMQYFAWSSGGKSAEATADQ